jgi:hypothetical protein
MQLGSKEITMSLKNIIAKVVVKKAASKIIPMEAAAPVLGKKAKLAGVLAAVAALVTALSNYMAG